MSSDALALLFVDLVVDRVPKALCKVLLEQMESLLPDLSAVARDTIAEALSTVLMGSKSVSSSSAPLTAPTSAPISVPSSPFALAPSSATVVDADTDEGLTAATNLLTATSRPAALVPLAALTPGLVQRLSRALASRDPRISEAGLDALMTLHRHSAAEFAAAAEAHQDLLVPGITAILEDGKRDQKILGQCALTAMILLQPRPGAEDTRDADLVAASLLRALTLSDAPGEGGSGRGRSSGGASGGIAAERGGSTLREEEDDACRGGKEGAARPGAEVLGAPPALSTGRSTSLNRLLDQVFSGALPAKSRIAFLKAMLSSLRPATLRGAYFALAAPILSLCSTLTDPFERVGAFETLTAWQALWPCAVDATDSAVVAEARRTMAPILTLLWNRWEGSGELISRTVPRMFALYLAMNDHLALRAPRLDGTRASGKAKVKAAER